MITTQLHADGKRRVIFENVDDVNAKTVTVANPSAWPVFVGVGTSDPLEPIVIPAAASTPTVLRVPRGHVVFAWIDDPSEVSILFSSASDIQFNTGAAPSSGGGGGGATLPAGALRTIDQIASGNVTILAAQVTAAGGAFGVSSGVATAITITLDSNIAIDDEVQVARTGAGAVTVSSTVSIGGDASGVTLNSRGTVLLKRTTTGFAVVELSTSSSANTAGRIIGSSATFGTLPLTSAETGPVVNGDLTFLTADDIGTGTAVAPQYPRGLYRRVAGVYTLFFPMML